MFIGLCVRYGVVTHYATLIKMFLFFFFKMFTRLVLEFESLLDLNFFIPVIGVCYFEWISWKSSLLQRCFLPGGRLIFCFFRHFANVFRWFRLIFLSLLPPSLHYISLRIVYYYHLTRFFLVLPLLFDYLFFCVFSWCIFSVFIFFLCECT